jgi:hypothetical protein
MLSCEIYSAVFSICPNSMFVVDEVSWIPRMYHASTPAAQTPCRFSYSHNHVHNKVLRQQCLLFAFYQPFKHEAASQWMRTVDGKPHDILHSRKLLLFLLPAPPPPKNLFIFLLHPPLSLRCGLTAFDIGSEVGPPCGRVLVVPRSLVGGVVGGVMTDSSSPGGGVSPGPPPPLLSVSALSDITEEWDMCVESRLAVCFPNADERDEDCVGRCPVGEREGSKADPEVEGGDLCDCELDCTLRCMAPRSSNVFDGSMSMRLDSSEIAV